MAFRNFEDAAFSRRSLLRGGAWLGAGTALAAMPMGRMAFAHAGHWPAVVGLVDKYTTTNKLANMVAVMGWGQKDPDVIAQGTLEMGKGPVADIDSLYRIYSMTKPVTGMAAMMLIDDGKLGLDQPLAEILPAYANMQVQKEYDGSIGEENLVPADRPITIRHLLTHTAGIGYGIIQKGPIVKAYNDRGIIAGQISRMPIPGLPSGTAVTSLEAFADGLAELPLVYQPGTKWSYSMSLDLLGRVIEVASGMPFDEFLTKNIFEPAGMDSTWFKVPESEAARLTTNYGMLNGMALPIDPGSASIFSDTPPFPAGGAGLVSSPRDYDRFQRMLLGYGKIDGKRVMGELAVRVGTSNILPVAVDTTGTFADGAGFGAGGRVGLGAQAGTFGWGGAAGTVALVNMKMGLRASIFTQYMPSDAYPIHSEFPAAVLSDLAAMQGA